MYQRHHRNTMTKNGHVLVTTQIHAEVIQRYNARLKQGISLTNTTLWDALVSNGVISLSDKEYIVKKHPAERDQANELLVHISKPDRENFEKFCKALRDVRQGHIVDKYLSEAFETSASGSSRDEAPGTSSRNEASTGPNKRREPISSKNKELSAKKRKKPASQKKELPAKKMKQTFLFSADEITKNWAYERYTPFLEYTKKCINQEREYKIKIAIIDSGMVQGHPVFSGFRIKVHDCTKESQSTSGAEGMETEEENLEKHGTFVLSIICAYLKDVANFVDEIQFFQIGNTEDENTYFKRIIKAYSKIVDLPEGYVICQSNGTKMLPPKSKLLKDLPKKLRDILDKHVLLCAASNSGAWESIAWPAKVSIAIGSVGEDGQSLGHCPRGPELHVLVPGLDIDGANFEYRPWDGNSAPYISGSGTSYANALAVALYAHTVIQVEFRLKGISAYMKEQLLTHDVAKILLQQLAQENSHSNDRGFGILLPPVVMERLESNEQLKVFVENALREARVIEDE